MKSNRVDAHKFYKECFERVNVPQDEQAVMAALGRNDLFFLLVRIFNRKDIDNDWLYERCKEVQANPDGHLDLWAREHYKSTLITYGLTIQNILNDPEITVGIFSHTRPIAKGFLRQIKLELEQNDLLKELYPDVLYAEPRKESPRWSEDNGICVKRKTNPKEATIEAHGLVDGQPTSKHFSLLIYDDVVTRESVSNPDMIAKVTEATRLSFNLGAHGGSRRFIGTRYHFNDTYRTIIEEKIAIPRIHTATIDGSVEGEPVFLDRETLATKRRDFGPYVFACQMLQNPKGDEVQGFKKEWLMFWDAENRKNLNIYILVDPASSKKIQSDYTVMLVIGLGADNNYYVIDGIRDRLNLTEKANCLFEFHKQYKPISVGYEKYGMQADIEHYKDKMNRSNYRFGIYELGGKTPKIDRIKGLIPLFEQQRIYLPKKLNKIDYEGKVYSFTQSFINDEYTSFPVPYHDDMLDCLARIADPNFAMSFPRATSRFEKRKKPYLRQTGGRRAA